MKKLESKQMEMTSGGGKNDCATATGVFCALTAILIFSTIFAPLAGATGPGCIAGLAAGCSK